MIVFMCMIKRLADKGWRGLAIPTVEDNTVVQRQLGYKMAAMGVASKCKYGYPQAVFQDLNEGKVGSSMVRLTCPHLCQHIDEWENDGAVKALTSELKQSPEWTAALEQVNERHKRTRHMVMRDKDEGVRKLGPAFMDSGIAGLSPGNADVKCVHAQVADSLLSNDNEIGSQLLDRLADRGCDVAGSDVCHQHCAASGPWTYFPAKNKQKLWRTRERRRAMKLRQQQESL